MVPLVDLTRRLHRYEADYVEAVRRVLRSGTVLLGDELAALESALAPVFGAAGAVGVSSGTLSRLPRAGVWMVRVKRIFAFVMLGVAEYYLIKMGQLLI